MEGRLRNCGAHAFLQVSVDTHHPLHERTRRIKGNDLKRGQSWIDKVEIIQLVYSPEDIEPGAERERVLSEPYNTFSLCIRLDRECRQQNSLAVYTDIEVLIYENFTEGCVVIHADGSVVWLKCS